MQLRKLASVAIALMGVSAADSYALSEFFWQNSCWPGFEGEPDSEVAIFDRVQHGYTEWENPFLTPVPSDVNTPTPAADGGQSTNEDAVLAQIGTDAVRVTGHPGIYSNEGVLSFVVYDNPSYNPGQVIFQVNTVGRLPATEAVIYYREVENGELFGPVPYTHVGFLMGGDSNTGGGGQGIMAWEWDLSAYNVAEYYIAFEASGTSMSLWGATLDTWVGYSAELASALFVSTNTSFGNRGSVDHHLSGETYASLTYEDGDTVVLEAVAEPGWAFVRWVGNVPEADVTNPTLTMTVDGSITAEAIFAPMTYDAWASDIILPAFTGGNPVVNGARDADPNQNGLINVLEYAFGGLPEEWSSPEALPVAGVSEDGKHLTLTYRRQPVATDLEYTVLVSNDMTVWNHNTDGSGQIYTTSEISPTINEDGTQNVIVTDMTDLSTLPAGTVRQMRLQISLD
ncbi:hypothetical protein H5P28_15915 [Ruficoccus amylovorans]|uniref:Bacterial repeat domain-containing protein n=1 Tax=Ruficoccus amylovorans TaxID=1804625 RepID=A0A842HJE7_9BACT|nr:hypothetical protein [Ruficoccus amylovorans]MBC2595754.1 hypothetical protein [Ruficoccus amylovorans]